MQPDDLRALSPLLFSHINPYGTFRLDLSERVARGERRDGAKSDEGEGEPFQGTRTDRPSRRHRPKTPETPHLSTSLTAGS